jgi:Tfp pilus assembly protein PilX
MRGLSGTKGRSLVVSTIILVAISLVTTAAAITYLISVEEAQTNVEQVVIRNVNVNPVPHLEQQTNRLFEGAGWTISITLTNKGNREATISNIFLNGNPLETYDNVAVFNGTQYVKPREIALSAPSGSSTPLSIALKQGADNAGSIVFSAGLYLELKYQLTSGAYCMQLVTLK